MGYPGIARSTPIIIALHCFGIVSVDAHRQAYLPLMTEVWKLECAGKSCAIYILLSVGVVLVSDEAFVKVLPLKITLSPALNSAALLN